jgi:phospholipase/carboxylesterase
MHLTLPKALRDAAIERGWALRHPLAVRGVVSPDVVFVFAPRNAAELTAAKLLLQASHAYASGDLAAPAIARAN